MFRHHHRFIPAVALAAALIAAAPAAAMPILDTAPPPAPHGTAASAGPCSEVCSAGGYSASTSWINPSEEAGVTLPHNPRGQADPAVASVSTGPCSEVCSAGGYVNPTAPTTVVRAVAPSDGFDWGDAGIGAAGALALMLLILGATVRATSTRRRASQVAVS
jgi:hypothetical protein